ncbi:MAG: MFS transporter [Fimbriimonadaceae bacterium]|nr:MFS transporter [Alphaproteobacteria bacterium]
MTDRAAKNSDMIAPLGGLRAWIIWTLGATAFGYAFFHRVAPAVMVEDLMRDFSVGGAVLGNLSAIYFYAYAGLQIPIGIMLDRWGPRTNMVVALTISAIGALIFSYADTVMLAYIGRFFVGMGSAAAFLGTLSLVGRWFPPHRFSLFSGMTMFVAMIVAIGSQGPLAALIGMIGWRAMIFYGAGIGFLLAILVFLIVRDDPNRASGRQARHQGWGEFGRALLIALKIPQVWYVSLLSTCMAGFMLAFGGLWGVSYLVAKYDVSRLEAGFYASFVFMGWAVGAPLGGWVSDFIKRRKLPLLLSSLVQTILLCSLFLLPDLSIQISGALIILSGISAGFMVNAFAYIREITDPRVNGAVFGLINGFTVGSGAVLQPLIGYLLDLNWDGTMKGGARIYSMAAYDIAMLTLVAASVIAFVCALMLRETYCQLQWSNEK